MGRFLSAFKSLLLVAVLTLFATRVASEEIPGSLNGSADAAFSGSAQYTVSVMAPAGTAGMEPTLTLNYDSNSGPSQYGLGWSLSGISAITRTVRTSYIDGRPGPINFDNGEDGFSNDALSMDGIRLVPAPESGFFAKIEDDQTRIQSLMDGSGNRYFKAKTKAGLTIYFGESQNSRIRTSAGSIYVWAATRIEDTFGNQIYFIYRSSNGDWGPQEIHYTLPKGSISSSDAVAEIRAKSFASVHFLYGSDSNSVTTSYLGGQAISRSDYVTSIESRFGSEPYRTYSFTYEDTTRLGGRVLRSIRETGADVDGSRPQHKPTEFEYSFVSPTWSEASDNYSLPEGFSSSTSLKNAYRFEDINSDDVPEIILSEQLGGREKSLVYRFDGTAWRVVPGLKPPVSISSTAETTSSDALVDLNGDGLSDLISSKQFGGSLISQAFLQSSDKWMLSANHSLPFPLMIEDQQDSRIFPVPETAEIDLVRHSVEDGGLEYWLFNGTAWSSVDLEISSTTELPRTLIPGNFPCSSEFSFAMFSESSQEMEFFLLDLSNPGDPSSELLHRADVGDIDGIPSVVSDGSCDRLLFTQNTGDTTEIHTVGLQDVSGTYTHSDLLVASLDKETTSLEHLFPAKLTDPTQQDLVVVTLGTELPNLMVFTFDSATNSWSRTGSYDYDPANQDFVVDSSYVPLAGKANADAREDIILLPANTGLATAALVNNGSRLSFSVDLVPPVHFSEQEKVGSSPNFVDLNSDGLVDLIGYHVNEDDKPEINAAFINLSSGWQRADRLKLPKPISHAKGGRTGQFVDFDSNGVVDFIYAYNGETGAWRIEFDADGNPTGWIPDDRYKIPDNETFSDPKLGDRGLRFADVDGDGRQDLLVARRVVNAGMVEFVRTTYLNSGSGWSRQPTGSPFEMPVPFVSRDKADVHFETKVNQGDYYRNLNIYLQDVNGDAQTDIVFRYQFKPRTVNTNGVVLYDPKTDGCLNEDKVVVSSTTPSNSTTYMHPVPTGTECAGVYYGTGVGWRNPGAGWVEAGGTWQVRTDLHFMPVALDLRITEENASTDFVDLNGDGFVDFLPARLHNSANLYPAYMNTGRGWVENARYSIPISALSADKKQESHRIIDLNADGLLDIAFHREGSKGTYFNRGNGWQSASTSFAPPTPFVDAKGQDLGVRFVDVDGNGLPDSLRSYRDKNGKLIQSAHLNSSSLNGGDTVSRTDLLVSVSSGLESQTRFSYRSLITPRAAIEVSDNDFYRPSPISSYPLISYVPTMYAVDQLTFVETDGTEIHTRYSYGGYRFNAQAMAVAGFETRTSRNFIGNSTSSVLEEIVEFEQREFLAGRPKTIKNSIRGTTTSIIESKYEVVGSSFPRLVQLSMRKTGEFDLDGTEKLRNVEQFEYDDYNNTTGSCIGYGDGSLTLVENRFEKSLDLLRPEIWILGRLNESTVHHVRPSMPLSCSDLVSSVPPFSGEEVLKKVARFSYDLRYNSAGVLDPSSTGVIVEEVSNADHELALTKRYEYDDFGNKVRVALFAEGERNRIQVFKYDARGRFPVVETNALGHKTTREFNEVLGLVVNTTDANGLSYVRNYNGFGALTTEVAPNGTTTQYARVFSEAPDVFGRPVSYEVVQQVGALPETKKLFDAQGRSLREESTGALGKRVIRVFQYDTRGREIRSSLPFFEGNTALFHNTEYDDLNRVVRITSPDGGVSTAVYSGTFESTVDALGRKTTKHLNLKGLTIKSADALGSEVKFFYGPGDELLRTVQTDGSVLSNTFDDVGNKIATDDPNLGSWHYRYNAFGEVTWQRDAIGQVTSVQYDLLGRPVERQMADNIETFTYDDEPMGIGKPSHISTSQGYNENQSYDSFGRIAKRDVLIDGELFTSKFTYDEYDRIVDTFHPGNFRTKNVYDDWGFLSKVLANDPSESFLQPLKEIWFATERDALGRITNESFGNGIRTETQFDELQGGVERLSVVGKDGTLLDLRLKYDVIGNLLTKSELTSGSAEVFRYDQLDRLTGWKRDRQKEVLYDFDTSGRLLAKSDVGTYTYSEETPAHAVSSIETATGESWNYKYNANGSLVHGPKGHFEYYANNLVKSIYRSDNLWSKFQYAPDGTRYQQEFSQIKKIGDIIGRHSVVRVTSVGAFEKIVDIGSPFGIAPHGYSRNRLYVTAETGVVAVLETNTQYDPLHGYAKAKLQHKNTPLAVAVTDFVESYLHKDELGSVVRVTDSNGKVISGYSYDPWGKKTALKFAASHSQKHFASSFRRGFTGHEHLENLALVHMNGRVFDPDIAQFSSADTFVQAPLLANSYNRYSYASNNPLKFVDPTGFIFKKIGKALKGIGDAIARPFREAGRWLRKNWREVVVTVVAVVIVVASGGAATPFAAIMIGAAAGAASAGLYVALYGGDLNDVLFAAARGAIIGGFSGGLTYGIGQLGLGTYGSAAAHGATQGVVSEAGGARFEQGFLSGAFSSLAGSYLRSSSTVRSSDALQVSAGAVVGGTASVIGGGKFANGAVSGAFVVALNHLAHKWRTKDFVKHYFTGNGEEINLSDKDVNLASEFENSASVREKVRNFINRVMDASAQPGTPVVMYITDTTITDVTNTPGLFSVGNSTFFMEGVCNNDSCSFYFSIRDQFAAPLFDDHSGLGTKSELPFGKSYPINHGFNQPTPWARPIPRGYPNQ